MTASTVLPRPQTRPGTGIDLPAAGRWDLHRTSFVGSTEGRRRHARLRMLDGWVDVGDPADDPFVLEVRADHLGLPRLHARAGSVIADGDGFARWPLEGEIHDVDDARRDVTGELSFHGVLRRGDQQWAWLSGKASTPRRGHRFAGRTDVAFELIAHRSPDGALSG